MKRCIWTILILAMATYAMAATSPSMQRILATSPKVTVDPSNTATKAFLFVGYSSASGLTFRRADLNSVFQIGGFETTAPDGTRIAAAINSTDISTAGLGTADAGLFYFNKSIGKFRYWDGTQLADLVGAASPPPAYDDTLLQAAINDRVTSTTHAADIAALNTRIDNLTYRMASLEAAFVAGGGTLAPSAEVSPASIDFGNVNTQNSSSNIPVTLTSTGNADLVLGTVGITGTGAAKYSVTSTTCNSATLVPGTTCMAQVMFSPGAVAGTYTAQLEFPHNATGTPTTVALTGTGVSTSDPAVTFFWNAENSLVADKGGITATNSGMAFNSTTYKTGAYSIEKNSNGGTLTFPVTASHVDVESGSLGFWFNSTNGYVASNYNHILKIADATDANRLLISQHSSGGIQVDWVANGVTSVANYTAQSLGVNTWYYITVSWNQPNTSGPDLTLAIYDTNGTLFANGAMTTANNIQAWTAAPTVMRMAYSGLSAYRFRLDHLVLSNDNTKDLLGVRNAGAL